MSVISNIISTKEIKSLVVFILYTNLFYALTPPNWEVEENNFEYTMTLIAFISLDNNRLSSVNDKVAAFVNDEVRGVANLTYVESEDAYYAYLTIFANENGEILNFKIYNSESDTIIDIDTTLEFEVLAHYGSLLQAFSIASPELSDEANIIDLYFQEFQVVSFLQNDDTLSLDILGSGGSDLGLSTIVFELSEGADIIYNNEILTSGVSTLNLDDVPIEIQIRSEDQSILRNITVEINIIEVNEPRFFKKNEVCHTLGAIRVIYNSEGANIILKQNGNTLSESLINNSEVIFDDLQAGSYEVQVGSITKTIIIDYVD